MSIPRQSAQDARGLLLVSGEPGPVSSWVRRGLVACQVVPLGPWTAVLPAERVSRAEPPYDGAVNVLAARPVPRRLRAALGLFVIDERAVITVQASGWRRPALRWLAWEPDVGAVRLPNLDVARPVDLAEAAGRSEHAAGVRSVVSDPGGNAERVLRGLMRVLALPGADLLAPDGGLRGQVVAPTAQAVARFEHRIHEQARHRAELEES